MSTLVKETKINKPDESIAIIPMHNKKKKYIHVQQQILIVHVGNLRCILSSFRYSIQLLTTFHSRATQSKVGPFDSESSIAH